MFPGCRCKKTDFFRIGFVATTLLAEILDLPRTVGARREVGCARIAQLHNALLKIMHELFLASDSSQNIIRVLFVDFTKAFDVIDDNVLFSKFVYCGMPEHVVAWISCVVAVC